jgi:iron(III) transport system ATP-binding protein
MSTIELAGVGKRFGSTTVLDGVDLLVPDGSTTAVLGASGSGKTTMLRLIAGFDRVSGGTVRIGGQVVDDGARSVRAQDRGVGYVPQEGALFPHLTVAGNIGFGLARRERGRVSELADLVGLAGLERRYPHQLSGGQQQRVALARALAIRPKVVLLDEPFGSLDASMRVGLRRDVARILAEAGTTTVLVTHDQDEAMSVADQITVLQKGRVLASADPRDLYGRPTDLAVATSVGDANVLSAHVAGSTAMSALGPVDLDPSAPPMDDGPAQLLLRPEQLVLHAAPPSGATTVVAARVVDRQYYGHDAMVHVAVDDPSCPVLSARVSGVLVVTEGDEVWVEVNGPGRAWPPSATPVPTPEAGTDD